MEYRRPGVYSTQRIAYPPLSGRMEPGVPAIVGYTERALGPQGEPCWRVPTLVETWEDFEATFGGPGVTVDVLYNPQGEVVDIGFGQVYYLHPSVRLFFENGGRSIVVVAVGDYSNGAAAADFLAGFEALAAHDLASHVLMPDSVLLSLADQGFVQGQLLRHCADQRHRFALLDLIELHTVEATLAGFRDHLQGDRRDLGAAYYPWIRCKGALQLDPGKVQYHLVVNRKEAQPLDTDILSRELRTAEPVAAKEPSGKGGVPPEVQALALARLAGLWMWMPPSGAVAGLVATTDRERDTFKAPANASLRAILDIGHRLTVPQQEDMNVHMEGLSVNALVVQPGRGVVVQGARTLDSNNREWRYVSVRRYFLAVEKAVRDHLQQFVFEANDAMLWHRVRGVLQGYCREQWRMGALMGADEEEAFYISVGLGDTMQPQDVLEGRLIVEIGLAVARPAEFIALQFVHHIEGDRTSIQMDSN